MFREITGLNNTSVALWAPEGTAKAGPLTVRSRYSDQCGFAALEAAGVTSLVLELLEWLGEQASEDDGTRQLYRDARLAVRAAAVDLRDARS